MNINETVVNNLVGRTLLAARRRLLNSFRLQATVVTVGSWGAISLIAGA